jgi:hypothetical protein
MYITSASHRNISLSNRLRSWLRNAKGASRKQLECNLGQKPDAKAVRLVELTLTCVDDQSVRADSDDRTTSRIKVNRLALHREARGKGEGEEPGAGRPIRVTDESTPFGKASAALNTLHERLDQCERALAQQASRRETAENELKLQEASTLELNRQLEGAMALADVLGAELSALEETFAGFLAGTATRQVASRFLEKRRVLYVGANAGSANAIRSIVERCGGVLVTHDGNDGEAQVALGPNVATASIVVFPVDGTSHDVMSTVKGLCDRYQVPYHPLRNGNVASFAELIGKLARAHADPRTPPSHFCLRHG